MTLSDAEVARLRRLLWEIDKGLDKTRYKAYIETRTRNIRFIREKYPVKSEKVEGELYHRYWIDEKYLAELDEVGTQVSEGTFFENLLS